VESGVIAARTIVAAGGSFPAIDAPAYAETIGAIASPGLSVPASVARSLLRVPPFVRFALDRWFLRAASNRDHAHPLLWEKQNASM
jgi:hypothetical protein